MFFFREGSTRKRRRRKNEKIQFLTSLLLPPGERRDHRSAAHAARSRSENRRASRAQSLGPRTSRPAIAATKGKRSERSIVAIEFLLQEEFSLFPFFRQPIDRCSLSVFDSLSLLNGAPPSPALGPALPLATLVRGAEARGRSSGGSGWGWRSGCLRRQFFGECHRRGAAGRFFFFVSLSCSLFSLSAFTTL